MIAVSNSTPLIHLAKSNQLDLLNRLFDRVHIPSQVFDETVIKGRRWSDSTRIEDAVNSGKLIVTPIADPHSPLFLSLSTTFGPGEAAAIVLAIEMNPDHLILDEREASRMAESLGLKGMLVGTIGLLARAKKMGVIPAIKPSLDALRATHLWIAEDFYRKVLESAGEV